MLKIEEPEGAQGGVETGWDRAAVWRLAFRPFYLLAAAFAAVAVPLWVARYFGALASWPQIDLNWHMHEMVFGFAVAVIVGFLFTAARAWTNLWTPRRAGLAGFVVLWLAGRVAMLSGIAWLGAVVDMLFLPLAALALFGVFARAGNKRNYFLVGLLSILSILNLLFHLSVAGLVQLSPIAAIEAAILVIVIIELTISGRVLPMFTANGAPGTKPVVHPRRDRIGMLLTALACIAWVVGAPGPLTAALAITAGSSLAVRLLGWQPHRTLRVPLLWIMHLSYAWIPAGFFLLALAALQLVSASAAFHALAVGSMAGLIMGMITRTTLGHTGRPLLAGKMETAMFVLIQLGAFARVAAALMPGFYKMGIMLAGTAWSAAFLLYLVVYAPYLMRPRIDGKEG